MLKFTARLTLLLSMQTMATALFLTAQALGLRLRTSASKVQKIWAAA